MKVFKNKFCIVSAFVTGSTLKDNMNNHLKLMKFLDEGGFDYYHQVGIWDGKAELSLLIPNVTLNLARIFRKWFGQEAVIYGEDNCFFLLSAEKVLAATSEIEFENLTPGQDHSVLFTSHKDTKYIINF